MLLCIRILWKRHESRTGIWTEGRSHLVERTMHMSKTNRPVNTVETRRKSPWESLILKAWSMLEVVVSGFNQGDWSGRSYPGAVGHSEKVVNVF